MATKKASAAKKATKKATAKKAAAKRGTTKKTAAKKVAAKNRGEVCPVCGGKGTVAREGALMTEYLQADGSWEEGPVPADRVPCPSCGGGYYPEAK